MSCPDSPPRASFSSNGGNRPRPELIESVLRGRDAGKGVVVGPRSRRIGFGNHRRSTKKLRHVPKGEHRAGIDVQVRVPSLRRRTEKATRCKQGPKAARGQDLCQGWQTTPPVDKISVPNVIKAPVSSDFFLMWQNQALSLRKTAASRNFIPNRIRMEKQKAKRTVIVRSSWR